MPCDAKLALAVLALEACIGYPRVLFAAIGHPVTWIGRLLAVLERMWNQPQFPAGIRRVLGVVTVVLVVGIAGAAGLAILQAAAPFEYGGVLVALVATSGLAQRSLYEHVRAVESALLSGGLDSARAAVGRIVGRDTTSLSASDVSAAAIESLAESFNDAVVAPAFWLLVGGLPGLLAYKALNTADSMIGHIEPRWRAFGWAAARLDDIANLVPARLAGVLLAFAAARGSGVMSGDALKQISPNAGWLEAAAAGALAVARSLRIMWRDAPKHASPNAGWPEAAAAGALDLRLGGPASYEGELHARPHFGDGASPRATDVARALALYRRGCAGLWLLFGSIAIVQVLL